jgi:serine phosphatase RsbU (regulator of sigma subunit)
MRGVMSKIGERNGAGALELRAAWAAGTVTSSAPEPAELDRGALDEQLAALHQERRQFYNELFEAAQVQRKLSGPRQWRRGRFEVASETFAVRFLSGDFVTLWEQEGALIFALGDIAGKGLAAGMWFTHIVSLLRVYAESRPDPAAVAAEVNRELCRLHPGPPITTLFLGKLDGNGGGLEYCSAGHPAPLLLRAQGTTEWLREGGPVLGAVGNARFDAGRVVLDPGDRLLAYSDGLLECRNAAGEEFGMMRILAAASRAEGASASSLLFSLLGAAQDFAASQPRQDDLSLLVVRHLEGVAN